MEVLAQSAAERETIGDAHIANEEIAALERLDVPCFTVSSTGCAANRPTDAIGSLIERSAFDGARNRIAALSPADCRRQTAILRSAFQDRVRSHAAPEATALCADELLEIAVRIATGLRNRALYDADGHPFWISLGYTAELEQYRFEPLNWSLYNGAAGVALFLAALDKVTGRGFRTLALGAIRPIQMAIAAGPKVFHAEQRVAMGGIGGWTSIVYVLARMSEFLGEPRLLDDAECLAAWITPELITAEARFDILAGAAGTILSLLALDAPAPEPCGRRIVTTVRTTHARARFWLAAGVIFATSAALNWFFAWCGGHRLRAAATSRLGRRRCVSRCGFAGTGLRAPKFRRRAWWLGRLPHAAARFSRSGRTAVASQLVSRGARNRSGSNRALAIHDSLHIRQEIEFALQVTAADERPAADNLCCGALGCADILLEGARRLNRPELRAAADAARRSLCRQPGEGAFHLFNLLPRSAYSPGFFQGAAGIGYECLRLAHPESLPSVLLLD